MKKLSLKTAAHLKREIAVSSEAKSAGIMEIYSEHFQRRMARRSPFEAAVSLCERAQRLSSFLLLGTNACSAAADRSVQGSAGDVRAGFPGQSGVCRDRQSTRKLSGSEAFPKQEKAIR